MYDRPIMPEKAGLEFLPPLPDELQPSRQELEHYLPNSDLYLQPDLPHHGVIHGESVMVLSAVMLNQFPDVDRAVVLHSAAQHDNGRLYDWALHRGEMKKHGPRGAEIIQERWAEMDPDLSDGQVENIVSIIHNHTPTLRDKIARRQDIKHPEGYDESNSDKLALHIVQDADHLDLVRGPYSRKYESEAMQSLMHGVGRLAARFYFHQMDRKGHPPHLDLRFPQMRDLYPWAGALAYTSRHDPEIVEKYANVPHRSGAALEAAQKLGIVKP